MRIQKYLASVGLGSRRTIEKLIAEKRIKVNGKTINLGHEYQTGDTVHIDGIAQKLSNIQEHLVLIYNKPIGYICSREDPGNHPLVFSQLPKINNARWVIVGRLDLNTSGLLLFTTNGKLAHQLMHPKHGIKRTYKVRVFGHVTKQQLSEIKAGIKLSDGHLKVQSIKSLTQSSHNPMNSWFEVTVQEGRNRVIRRLFEHYGHRVNQLIRTHYAGIQLPSSLKPGQHSYLTNKQIKNLHDKLSN